MLLQNSYHRNLYSTRRVRASVAVFLALSALMAAVAQHRASHKLRATAVVEITADEHGGKIVRLFPVTILDGGRFRDASIYESRPWPMAIGRGIVYEAQNLGVPVGYLTISNATEKNGTWVAGGDWVTADVVAKQSAPPPPPVTTQPDKSADDRPILRRSGGSSGGETPAPASPVPPSAPAEPSASSTPPAPAPTTESAPSPSDPNRPVLRHQQQHTTAQAQQEVENQPQITPDTTKHPTARTALSASAPGTQILVAVSDAQPTETRSWEFHSSPEEKQQIESKMRKLALEQLPQESPALTESALKNVVVRAFDLDLSNDAVVVLSAEAPPARTAPAALPAVKGKRSQPQPTQPVSTTPRYVTVIARMDIDGNPTRLLVSVADAAKLDIAPRLELIDAVDVDGDGYAELLFRTWGLEDRGFVIYGVGHGTVTRVFEGATQSLKPSVNSVSR
ncbi:MAG TPA: hypothetical protein VFK06_05005 [Candidatus Angelobacter sp.]|nr:hypothetical protein [Candidatus Angelobacter sp.]